MLNKIQIKYFISTAYFILFTLIAFIHIYIVKLFIKKQH